MLTRQENFEKENTLNQLDGNEQQPAECMCLTMFSYTGVKTSAVQHHTVKTKDEHHEQRMLTPHYPFS